MDSYDVDKIKKKANLEVIRRLLIRYFIDKGYNSFDKNINPIELQDLVKVIPILGSKVEVIPYAKDLDPSLGRATLGWNLFVLGSYRMYLGETFHSDVTELAKQIRQGIATGQLSITQTNSARKQTTPRNIIIFITRVLDKHEDGYVNLNPGTQQYKDPGEVFASRHSMLGMPQHYYSKSTFPA